MQLALGDCGGCYCSGWMFEETSGLVVLTFEVFGYIYAVSIGIGAETGASAGACVTGFVFKLMRLS